MTRKMGFAITALFRGKRRTFPKRFRKRSTAEEFIEHAERNEIRLGLKRRKRRVVKAVGQRSTGPPVR